MDWDRKEKKTDGDRLGVEKESKKKRAENIVKRGREKKVNTVQYIERGRGRESTTMEITNAPKTQFASAQKSPTCDLSTKQISVN